MVVRATGQPAVTAVPAVSGAAERNTRVLGQPTAQPAEAGQEMAYTSHSYTLSTSLFQLDMSWGRLELGPGQSAGPAGSTARIPAAMSAQEQRDEYQRRQQLLGLLSAQPAAPRGRTIQSASSGQVLRQPSEARRAYAKAAGPLAGDLPYNS